MQSKIFQNQKNWVPGLPELVNHSCLGEGECLHPFKQNSDQNFQNKVYRLFFRRKFLKTGSHTLNFIIPTEIIQSSHKRWQLLSTHLRILTQNFAMISENFLEIYTFFQGGTYFCWTVYYASMADQLHGIYGKQANRPLVIVHSSSSNEEQRDLYRSVVMDRSWHPGLQA